MSHLEVFTPRSVSAGASAATETGRQTPKVRMSWRFVMLFFCIVFGFRSRFTKLRGPIDRWRCSRCQRFARNKLTLAALKRMACVPLYGAASGAAPSIQRVHSSHRVRRSGPITWCTMCGAYSSNRSFARQCCPGTCPSDTRSQRLRQLVIGRHPITGAWLLDDAAQPV